MKYNLTPHQVSGIKHSTPIAHLFPAYMSGFYALALAVVLALIIYEKLGHTVALTYRTVHYLYNIPPAGPLEETLEIRILFQSVISPFHRFKKIPCPNFPLRDT